MILDKLLEFDPAGTAITATATSTNILDMLQARDMGIGDHAGATPKLLVACQQTFTAAGAATLNIQFQSAPDNGSGAPGTWTTAAESSALPLASLVAGLHLFDISLPHRQAGAAIPRFYRLNYVVATGPMTAGTVQSELVLGRDNTPAYPSGFTVAN